MSILTFLIKKNIFLLILIKKQVQNVVPSIEIHFQLNNFVNNQLVLEEETHKQLVRP
jgi:hypothetical protein